MEGWIKLHRCLLDKAIWKCSTPEQKALLITILLLANHEENQWVWKGEKYICKPGEFITSYNKLAKVTGISYRQTRYAVDKFESLHFLSHEVSQCGVRISLVNWDLYQLDKKNVSHLLSDECHTCVTPVATNKNDKNDKNIDMNDIHLSMAKKIKLLKEE